MALVWVSTGYDENGNETGYNIDDGTGQVWDSSGNLLDSTTAQPVDLSQVVTVGADTYVPNGDGTYSVNGGSTSVTAGELQTIQNGNTPADPNGVAAATAAGTAGPGVGVNSSSSGIGALASGLADKISSVWKGLSPAQQAAMMGAGAAGISRLINGGPTTPTGPGQTAYSIPSLSVSRSAVNNATPTAADYLKNGAQGKRYFSDTLYAPASNQAALQGITDSQAMDLGIKQRQQAAALQQPAPAPVPQPQQPVQAAAHGGVMHGQGQQNGIATGRYLQGPTDGMADDLPANIDGKQPAKLSHGEFVIPADVVSHLGNGNSDAGAKKLYSMMASIRKARTGNPKQGKQINPDQFMPGGITKLATGGQVPGYALGGTTTTTNTAVPNGATGAQQNLSDWAAPYVTNMLGQGAAVANQPYQAYQGPLSAGSSALQQQASDTLQNAPTNANYGKSYTDTGVAQQYMNPYLSNVLDPQLQEMRRQSDITQVGNDAKMVGAGAFGGTRQALLTAENQRNLGSQIESATGNAYSTAYNNGQQQFNTEQGQANQQLQQKEAVGATDQATTQAGITADINQFNTERDNPYKMVQFQQSLLQNLPIQNTQYTTPSASWIDQLAQGAQTGTGLYNLLYGTPAATTAPKA